MESQLRREYENAPAGDILKSFHALLPAEVKPSGEIQEPLPFELKGSQRKVAFALRKNAEAMCAEAGIDCIGFMTLTVGEYHFEPDLIDGQRRRFVQVYDAKEASRRINNANRRLLNEVFEKWICVTERHKSRAIHFHILGIVRGRPDIRTGFDWEALKERDYRSASPALRDLWAKLLRRLPRLGFGRTELTPVKKSGEAVSSYVAKYIEKCICNRIDDDKRKKLVRYLGWKRDVVRADDVLWLEKSYNEKFDRCKRHRLPFVPPKVTQIATQLRPNDFAWGTPGAIAWRIALQQISAVTGLTPDNVKEKCGPRWAWRFRKALAACIIDIAATFSEPVREKIETYNATVAEEWTDDVQGRTEKAFARIADRPVCYWVPEWESDAELWRVRRENVRSIERWEGFQEACAFADQMTVTA